MQNDEYYFEVEIAPQADGIVASSFTRSPEYLGHPLVQECSVRGETVVPISLYSDGVKVCCDSHPDTLYGIYVNFIHRDADECTKKANKHVVTVYRKSDVCNETLTDIWNIILWDLKALAVGCKPRLGEEVKPLEEQVPDEPLGGMWVSGTKFVSCRSEEIGHGTAKHWVHGNGIVNRICVHSVEHEEMAD